VKKKERGEDDQIRPLKGENTKNEGGGGCKASPCGDIKEKGDKGGSGRHKSIQVRERTVVGGGVEFHGGGNPLLKGEKKGRGKPNKSGDIP